MNDLQQRIIELENMYDRLADNPSWVHPEVVQASFGWMLKEIMDLQDLLPIQHQAVS